jgi:hypothetical protein
MEWLLGLDVHGFSSLMTTWAMQACTRTPRMAAISLTHPLQTNQPTKQASHTHQPTNQASPTHPPTQPTNLAHPPTHPPTKPPKPTTKTHTHTTTQGTTWASPSIPRIYGTLRPSPPRAPGSSPAPASGDPMRWAVFFLVVFDCFCCCFFLDVSVVSCGAFRLNCCFVLCPLDASIGLVGPIPKGRLAKDQARSPTNTTQRN